MRYQQFSFWDFQWFERAFEGFGSGCLQIGFSNRLSWFLGTGWRRALLAVRFDGSVEAGKVESPQVLVDRSLALAGPG